MSSGGTTWYNHVIRWYNLIQPYHQVVQPDTTMSSGGTTFYYLRTFSVHGCHYLVNLPCRYVSQELARSCWCIGARKCIFLLLISHALQETCYLARNLATYVHVLQVSWRNTWTILARYLQVLHYFILQEVCKILAPFTARILQELNKILVPGTARKKKDSSRILHVLQETCYLARNLATYVHVSQVNIAKFLQYCCKILAMNIHDARKQKLNAASFFV